jgi:hypothetical protein
MIPFVRPSRLHPLHYHANRDADTSLNGQIGARIHQNDKIIDEFGLR